MNNQNLIQVQRSIEQFFYKVRVNIALHNIMETQDYKAFRKQMRIAIENQILYFAKIEKVNEVVGAQKSHDIYDNLLLLYPVLQQFIDQEDFRNYLLMAAEKGADAANNLLRTNTPYDIPARMGKEFTSRVTSSMSQIDGTTMNWIGKTLQDAMDRGLSSYDTAKLLRDAAREEAIMRSEMIAEQEAAWALGETQLDLYQEAGVAKKKLITSRDESVCPLCLGDEEAGEIDASASFPSGAVATPIHIRCRCFVMPVLRDPIAVNAQ